MTTPVFDTGYIQKAGSFDFSNANRISIWFYNYGAISDFPTANAILLQLYTDAGATKGFTTFFPKGRMTHVGWNLLSRHKSLFTAIGSSPSWNDPILYIRLLANSDTGKTVNVTWDTLRTRIAGQAAVLLTFDDAKSEIYTNVYPILKAHNMRGTIYTPTALIGTAGYMTVAQLQELYRAGWSISNHTNNHVHLTSLSEADQETEISAATAALDGWGLTKASKHIAYPFGEKDANTLTAMTNLGMQTGRTTLPPEQTAGDGVPELSLPFDLPYEIPTYQCTTMSLATAETYIDGAITRGVIQPFFYHNLAGEWDIATYQSFIEYIASKRSDIIPITIDDFQKLQSSGVRVPRPI